MTSKEVIETLKIALAEVEWNYPMDYSIAIEEAIKAVEFRDKYNLAYVRCYRKIDNLGFDEHKESKKRRNNNFDQTNGYLKGVHDSLRIMREIMNVED